MSNSILKWILRKSKQSVFALMFILIYIAPMVLFHLKCYLARCRFKCNFWGYHVQSHDPSHDPHHHNTTRSWPESLPPSKIQHAQKPEHVDKVHARLTWVCWKTAPVKNSHKYVMSLEERNFAGGGAELLGVWKFTPNVDRMKGWWCWTLPAGSFTSQHQTSKTSEPHCCRYEKKCRENIVPTIEKQCWHASV